MSFLISSVLFQQAKMIISVLVTRMIVDRNLAVRVYHTFIVVSYKSIQSKTTVFGLPLQTLSLVKVK